MNLSEAAMNLAKSHRDDIRSGSFHELSAQEFARRTDLRVLVIKSPHSVHFFRRHAQVVAVEDGRGAEDYLRQWESPQIVGLVCPDGEISSRLAIRLSRQGHTVVHLAGGLKEWCETFDCGC